MVGDMDSALKRFRLAKYRTLTELSHESGLSVPNLWKWENGQAQPKSPTQRRAFAKALGITIAELGGLVYDTAQWAGRDR